MINDRDVPVNVATRARIILLHAEHRLKKDIVALAGVSLPTVNQWISRCESEGVQGLLDRSRAAGTGAGEHSQPRPCSHAGHSAGGNRTDALVVAGAGEVRHADHGGFDLLALRRKTLAGEPPPTLAARHL